MHAAEEIVTQRGGMPPSSVIDFSQVDLLDWCQLVIVVVRICHFGVLNLSFWRRKEPELFLVCPKKTGQVELRKNLGMHAAEGIVTQRGGMTSHAAVVGNRLFSS